MKIRLATTEDVGILAVLLEELHLLHVREVPHVFKQPDRAAFCRDIEANLMNSDSRIIIGEVDSEPAGYAYVLIMRREENAYAYARQYVHVDQFAVSPRFQRQGCGRELMQAVFDLAKDEGIERVTLDTWAFNTGAQAFYAQMGFEPFTLRLETFLTTKAEEV